MRRCANTFVTIQHVTASVEKTCFPTAEQDDKIVERMYKEGVHPDPELELELCFGSGDQMKVSLLFDSKEHFESFGAKIGPILSEMGMDPGEPEVLEIHNIIRRNS